MGNMEVVIRTAMNIPTVRVNRVEFLRKELNGKVSDDIIELAIKDGTKKAGVPVELVEKLAKNAINSKALLTVTASFLSGLPGGLVGLLGGSSADIIQYYANFLNLAQKLMYLYGYGDINDLTTSQEEIMIVVMGLASGVEVANAFLKKVLTENAGKWAKAIVLKNTSKNVFKVVSEKVLATLGRKSATRIAEEQATRIAGKAVPVVRGVISGAISAVTFKPMAKKLNKSFREFYTYIPKNNEVIYIEDFIDL